MVTRSRIVVLVLLVLIVILAAWSRLRHVEESDHAPQRIRLEEHPAFQEK
jgi:lipopolysaccharide export system protein LptC